MEEAKPNGEIGKQSARVTCSQQTEVFLYNGAVSRRKEVPKDWLYLLAPAECFEAKVGRDVGEIKNEDPGLDDDKVHANRGSHDGARITRK